MSGITSNNPDKRSALRELRRSLNSNAQRLINKWRDNWIITEDLDELIAADHFTLFRLTALL